MNRIGFVVCVFGVLLSSLHSWATSDPHACYEIQKQATVGSIPLRKFTDLDVNWSSGVLDLVVTKEGKSLVIPSAVTSVVHANGKVTDGYEAKEINSIQLPQTKITLQCTPDSNCEDPYSDHYSCEKYGHCVLSFFDSNQKKMATFMYKDSDHAAMAKTADGTIAVATHETLFLYDEKRNLKAKQKIPTIISSIHAYTELQTFNNQIYVLTANSYKQYAEISVFNTEDIKTKTKDVKVQVACPDANPNPGPEVAVGRLITAPVSPVVSKDSAAKKIAPAVSDTAK